MLTLHAQQQLVAPTLKLIKQHVIFIERVSAIGLTEHTDCEETKSYRLWFANGCEHVIVQRITKYVGGLIFDLTSRICWGRRYRVRAATSSQTQQRRRAEK